MARQILKENAIAEIKKRCHESYLYYVEMVHRGGWKPAKHLIYLCNEIEKVLSGENKRVIITMPPRHSKSMTVTETLPSYFLGKNPKKRVIVSSYGDDLAQRFGRLNRQKITEFGEDIFGIKVSPVKASQQQWEIEKHGGGMISTGIGGALTGHGADCFPKGTMVLTELGEMEISCLVEKENPPHVLSYDLSCGKIVYNKILATREIKRNDFITIKTVDGRKITATSEHPFYTKEYGYREAAILAPGDTLLKVREAGLSDMPKSNGQEKQNMPSLLRRDKANSYKFILLLVWQTISTSILQLFKKYKSWAKRFLLFDRMFSVASCNKEQQKMSGLWQYRQEWKPILFSELFKFAEKAENQISRENLPCLSNNISTQNKSGGALFEDLCGSVSFKQDEESGQSGLQRWIKLFNSISKTQTDNIKARWAQMCNMWCRTKPCADSGTLLPVIADEPCGASYRRKCEEYEYRESYNPMQYVSCDSSQVEEVAISSITRHCEQEQSVYDLQIEGTSNFFANGILVHNCLIIDDPVKNREQAFSKNNRDLIWQEWLYTLKTRLHPGAAVLVILTRWHEDDLAGRLLSPEMNGDGVEDWKIINLPAVCEEDNDPIGRNRGDLLWPEHGFDESWVQEIKKDSRSFASLYQQRPAPEEGAMIKRDWWKYYKQMPEKFDEMVQSWDCSFKEKEDSDFVVGMVIGRIGADKYVLDIVKRRMGITKTMDSIRYISSKWPQARAKLIEDKANGTAIIEMLSREISGIIAVDPQGGKMARVNAVLPEIESGNVWLPQNASWADEFVEECAMFPNGKNDDQVDAFSQGMLRYMKRRTPNLAAWRQLINGISQ